MQDMTLYMLEDGHDLAYPVKGNTDHFKEAIAAISKGTNKTKEECIVLLMQDKQGIYFDNRKFWVEIDV